MNELETLRTDPSTWGSVAFAAAHTEKRGTFDSQARARLRVLIALQYDRRESDVELIRHLFTNEVVAAENDSFQGYGDGFSLAAFLLARFRDPNDVPLFARAKFANFDTGCGFSVEFMFFVGGDQTAQLLEANSPELWARLQSFHDITFAPDDLEEWWRFTCADYPDAEKDERPWTLYQRALSLNDMGLARRRLERWAEQEPESSRKRSSLRYAYAELGDFKKAAQLAAGLLEGCTKPWDRACALSDLVELHRKAGEFSLSLNAAQQLDATFAGFDRWVGLGLGRMAIKEVFELSIIHPDAADAAKAFAIADRWYQRSRDLFLLGWEAGARAARRCGLVEKAWEYEQLAGKERKRIDEEKKSILHRNAPDKPGG